MGLRERKKEKTRRIIQETAIRLFLKQGYSETTVEQIAAAAEISPATFYRYFPEKKDAAVSVDYKALNLKLIQEVRDLILQCAPGETLERIVRKVYRHLAGRFEGERDLVVTRFRIMKGVPELKENQSRLRQAAIEAFAAVLAPRFGVSSDHHELRMCLAISAAVESETLTYWGEHGGTDPLDQLFEQAYRKIRPTLRLKSHPAGRLHTS